MQGTKKHRLFGFAGMALAVVVIVTGGLSSITAEPGPGIEATASPDRATKGITTGADVTIISLGSVGNWGSSGGIQAYSVGTDSCNIGSEPLFWCDNPGIPGCETNEHPVIAQNLYRLKDGRFEQIGMSWLKHGFLSTNSFDFDCVGNDGNGNEITCQGPPLGNDQLGVGCTDFYSADLNGSQPLGRRSEVNATTGVFPFPPGGGGAGGSTGQRLQVLQTDLDPVLNSGARYWVEGQYVAPDDAEANNGLNNASYREVVVDPSDFDLSTAAPTVREQAAIFAWREADPEVEIVNVDFTSAGSSITERFHAARRVWPSGTGWHYEFAIHNMNSDRGARSFALKFPDATVITNVGFRDVEHHSGEPYEGTDWVTSVNGAGGTIAWLTDPASANPNANALRWGTMFSFWFDADAPPVGIMHTISLYKNGTPTSVDVPFAQSLASIVFVDGFESGAPDNWSSSNP